MGACRDRLVLGGGGSGDLTELEYVKGYLRVEHEADDDLVGALIVSAKAAADDFLQNPFTELRSIVRVSGAVEGSSVVIDKVTFRASSSPPADFERVQTTLLQDFLLGATDEGTAENLADLVNDPTWGAPRVIAEQAGNEVSLRWRDGRTSPVAATEYSSTMRLILTRVDSAIPEAVAIGVLRTIAAWYDQRQDGIASQAISGQGSQNYGASSIALHLWSPHRRLPGL